MILSIHLLDRILKKKIIPNFLPNCGSIEVVFFESCNKGNISFEFVSDEGDAHFRGPADFHTDLDRVSFFSHHFFARAKSRLSLDISFDIKAKFS